MEVHLKYLQFIAMNKLIKQIKNKICCDIPIMIISFIGIILRIIYGLKATPLKWQHDIMSGNGHMYYTLYVFSKHSLPNTNNYQFYQPPLNAILQSVWMKICSFFARPELSILSSYKKYVSGNYEINVEKDVTLFNYIFDLYCRCNILSIVYSIITLIVIFKIVDELIINYENKVNKFVAFFIKSICSIYPGMIILSGQYNNDCLAYMFIFLSLFFAIKWCKKKNLLNIILLALSIGFGMLTKLSVGILAFVIGPMMMVIWIRFLLDKKKIKTKRLSENITFQLFVFALIVFPLGLSYVVRNNILFNQSILYVWELPKTSKYYIKGRDIYERVLSLPLERINVIKYNIFHDPKEYNIWIDLLKTSIFDEMVYKDGIINIVSIVLLVCNSIFYVFGIISFVISIITFMFIKKRTLVDLKLISLMLIALFFATYIPFCLKYKFSCSSSYRYAVYTTFAFSSLIGCSFSNIKLFKILMSILIMVMSISMIVFTLLY